MGRLGYFFDTYALLEFIQGNQRYKKYFEDYEVVTTLFNLIELFYNVLREFGLEKARYCYNKFKPYIIEVNDDVIEQALLFRLKNYKLDLSYVDCIGYALAKEKSIKFFTGDSKFKNFENVEFVK